MTPPASPPSAAGSNLDPGRPARGAGGALGSVRSSRRGSGPRDRALVYCCKPLAVLGVLRCSSYDAVNRCMPGVSSSGVRPAPAAQRGQSSATTTKYRRRRAESPAPPDGIAARWRPARASRSAPAATRGGCTCCRRLDNVQFVAHQGRPHRGVQVRPLEGGPPPSAPGCPGHPPGVLVGGVRLEGHVDRQAVQVYPGDQRALLVEDRLALDEEARVTNSYRVRPAPAPGEEVLIHSSGQCPA